MQYSGDVRKLLPASTLPSNDLEDLWRTITKEVAHASGIPVRYFYKPEETENERRRRSATDTTNT